MTAATRGQVALLGGLTAVGSLGIQMVVPVLPQAAAELGVSGGEVALVVTVYLVGLAAAQLVHGPLSDAVGRRPVLLGGTIAFALASALAWAAPNLELLLAARFVQAVGAAATLVAARAMVADAGGEQGASAMAYLMAIVMLSPMAAPLIGSGIALAAGWRAVFAALGLAAGLALAGAWARAPETLAHRVPLSARSIAAGWRQVAASGPFRRHAAIAALTSGGLYSFLTLSPFLYVDAIGLPAAALGLHYGTVACGAAVGALASGRMLRRRAAASLLRRGALLLLVAALLVVPALAIGRAFPLTAAMALFALAGGIVGPTATIAAIAAPDLRRGVAASAYGACQMAGGALFSALAAALPHRPATLGALLVASAAAVALLARPRG